MAPNLSSLKWWTRALLWCTKQLSAIAFAVTLFLWGLPDKADRPEAVDSLIDYSQRNALVIWPILFFTNLALSLLLWLLRDSAPKEVQSPVLNRLIEKCLVGFRNSVFPNEIPEGIGAEQNRVTIFKHVKKSWRGYFRHWCRHSRDSGWLVIRHRSCHVTKKSSTLFLAPDKPQHAEGVAGYGWTCNGDYRVPKLGSTGKSRLPNLNQRTYPSHRLKLKAWFHLCRGIKSECAIDYIKLRRDVRRYSELTRVHKRFIWSRLRSGQNVPTSILVIKLVNPANRGRWGVAVVDSSNLHECIDSKEKSFKTALTKMTNRLAEYGVFDE